MDTYDYLIIGGGIAGTTAAETLRKDNAAASIAIISDEPHRLYSRVMLSKSNFFLEKIPFDHIWLKNEQWYADNAITFVGGKTVTHLAPLGKTITLDDGRMIGFGKLLIATGLHVRKLDVPGADMHGVHYVKTLDDAKGIINGMKGTRHAVVVGGGFIGFEMSDMLRAAGIDVTVVIRKPYFWKSHLVEDAGMRIEQVMEKGGVSILRNAEITKIVGTHRVEGVETSTNVTIACDMVIVGIGGYADTSWLQSSGIDIERGIRTNEYLETSLGDVYAAGDVAEFDDVILNQKMMEGIWLNAQIQGRIAARNMAGQREPFSMVAYYTARGFDTSVSFCGDIRKHEGALIVSRAAKDKSSFAHYLLRDGRMVGSTLVNRGSELGTVMKLIKLGTHLAQKRAQLEDPDFELKSLLE